MTVRNFTMTLEFGLIRTCLLPRFSALQIELRASFKTFTRTILPVKGRKDGGHYNLIITQQLDSIDKIQWQGEITTQKVLFHSFYMEIYVTMMKILKGFYYKLLYLVEVLAEREKELSYQASHMQRRSASLSCFPRLPDQNSTTL